jgi:hypothetical protein
MWRVMFGAFWAVFWTGFSVLALVVAVQLGHVVVAAYFAWVLVCGVLKALSGR